MMHILQTQILIVWPFYLKLCTLHPPSLSCPFSQPPLNFSWKTLRFFTFYTMNESRKIFKASCSWMQLHLQIKPRLLFTRIFYCLYLIILRNFSGTNLHQCLSELFGRQENALIIIVTMEGSRPGLSLYRVEPVIWSIRRCIVRLCNIRISKLNPNIQIAKLNPNI